MSIEKTKSTYDWIESKLKTKTGMFTLGLIFSSIPLGFVVWMLFSQLNQKTAVIEKNNEQIIVLLEQQAKIRDECAETMRKYFEMFKEMNVFANGSLNTINSIHRESNQIMTQQNLLINNTLKDEED